MTPSQAPAPSQEPAGDDMGQAEGDLYLEVVAHADGSFTVMGDVYDSLEEALKAIIRAVRAHPMSGNAQEQMTAGYEG